MVIITTMILISLPPFSFKKIVTVVVALICLSSVVCFAETTFSLVKATPYDHQMTRIESVFSTPHRSSNTNVSLALVNAWMGDLRSIPYGFSQEWKTPAEVQAGPVADCKGKAVALYERMRAAGADGLRLVIGKRASTSRRTHAWLEWSTPNGTYVLDPTINWSASRIEQLGSNNYIPLYAYSGTRKYRAAVTTLYAQN
jgi:predicted transglutaminase-like cysteine proteinase